MIAKCMWSPYAIKRERTRTLDLHLHLIASVTRPHIVALPFMIQEAPAAWTCSQNDPPKNPLKKCMKMLVLWTSQMHSGPFSGQWYRVVRTYLRPREKKTSKSQQTCKASILQKPSMEKLIYKANVGKEGDCGFHGLESFIIMLCQSAQGDITSISMDLVPSNVVINV